VLLPLPIPLLVASLLFAVLKTRRITTVILVYLLLSGLSLKSYIVRHHTQAQIAAGNTHTANNGTGNDFLAYFRFAQSIPDKEAGYRAASKIDLQAHCNNDSDDGAEGELFTSSPSRLISIHSRR
jgi:hypothetical protein